MEVLKIMCINIKAKTLEHGKISFLILLFFFSCTNNRHENSNTNVLAYYTITNESLINEIVKYSDEVKPSKWDKIIHIEVTHSYDTVSYMLYYSGSAFGILQKATVFAQVNGNTIAVTFDTYFNRGDFILPDSIAWLYLKDIDVFKEEYEYFLEWNWYPPPPTESTGLSVLWILQYVDGTLVKKEETSWEIIMYDED